MRSWVLVAPALVTVLTGLALAPPARACSRYPRFPTLVEPVLEAPEHYVVTTRIELACRPQGIDAECTLVARFRIHNRGAAAARTRGMILASQMIPSLAFEGGAPIAVAPVKADPNLLRNVDCDESIFSGRTQAFAFELPLAADEARDVTLRSTFTIDKYLALVGGYGDCNTDEGVQHRHPFASAGRSAGMFGFRYAAYANRAIEPNAKLSLRVRQPRAWENAMYRGSDDVIASVRADGDDVVYDAELPFDPMHQVVHLSMSVARGAIFNGGPFVGAQWSFAPDSGARLRVGYEVASPAWLLESIAVESDLGRRLVVVPAVEAVTSTQLVLGAGLGAPIRVRPDTRVGGRLQLSASVWIFQLRGAFDFYPAMSSLPAVFEGSLGPELSF